MTGYRHAATVAAFKRDVDDLALLGGRPEFPEPLHVGLPNLPDRAILLRRIEELLDRNWLTNGGPMVREFEQRVAELAGTKHCVATCNCTNALQILVRASGLHGEVIVPSFTYVATAHAVHWAGATPVFCDVDSATGTIDPAAVRRLVTPRTTGIIGVHLWGHACPVEPLQEIARRYGLTLLFDAAHAVGCSYLGRPVGSLGTAAALSFHATKLVNTFEGGAVVTDDDALARRVRAMHNFGFDEQGADWLPGTNAKMTEVAAAMGLSTLDNLGALMATNRVNYERYRDRLADIHGVHLRAPRRGERTNHQYVVVEIDERVTGVDRDTVLAVLRAENVLAKNYFHPGCHRMEPYRRRPQVHTPVALPRTEALAERVLVLPTGPAITADHIDRIAAIIRLVVHCGVTVRERVAATHPNGIYS